MRNNIVLAVVAAVHLCPAVESFAPPAAKVRSSSSITTASLFNWGKRQSEKGDSQDDVISQQDVADEQSSSLLQNSRRSFLSATAASSLLPLRSSADTASVQTDKQLNLSNEELKKIVLSDIVDKSFLVSADITRSIYDESATFTDEIDVYTMDKWVKGTKALFIASGSRVSLVGDVDVSASEVVFRFDEDLMFNIPFKPVCALTGKVVLTRDENTGLITSYREYWDQSVNDVLKTAKFGKKA
ncbi:hypothetical protein QTG54_001978 [Skeletonema marinoi]|uniref:Plastid lipid-associated protein/fibrillin conserved domain-containing protein n=2 Tax=Skeletonema marinoi TaxID=267567 RepID=A0AAD8YMF8_9STRA|nr:hypothetical protein QTG54_001978 [Skeletonema marinoi]|mmetsp:Transcript_38041/g.77699  ORF Transcript_38041/g.77699 Transcript_38041/m.77699 type:complete len:243 (-) Transcript_38041:1169-1897(-)|eukprot:scaffold7968_cov137-Skeletonema_marinoi.AAC.3